MQVSCRANMGFHARDPYGVRHVESRKQAREASTLKTTLETIFSNCEMAYRRVGDDEIMRRVRIDDVIMSPGCRAAYIHVAACGDRLEQRQAFVWLARNKGSLKNAIARHYKTRGRMPHIYFVESKFDEWLRLFDKGRKYPELNLPDPYQQTIDFMPEIVKPKFRQAGEKQEFRDKMGMGDETKPYPPRGYPPEAY